MKHIVVGTAGHIDHGKTSLIKALTGRETDTLEEEKKRGISINLGFTYFDLPSGKTVGIVDVPGHEKFIKNMLAGASGLDMVILVVAADEGIMPQTIEHVDILSYLNIRNGIIVITKCDMVDEEMLSLVEDDIKEGLLGTFLENADVIKVDSISKRGVKELIDKLDKMSEEIRSKNTELPARMNIDRVFSVKGFGTVVTGTIIEGKISQNDELEIYSSEFEGRKTIVRNIQVHGKDQKEAYAGQRTAINISNIKVGDLKRGDILAKPNSMVNSMMIDVKVRLLKHDNCKLHTWERLKLYHGTREILCRAVPLEKETMNPGDEGYVQLRLEEKIICKKLDPFVIRTYSPMDTIGGGIIIDISKEKHTINKNDELIKNLKVKESGDPRKILEIFLKNNSSKYPKITDMTSYVGVDQEKIKSILDTLRNEEKIVEINNNIIHIDYYYFLESKLLRILDNYHNEYKLRIGMPKQEAGTKVDSSFKVKDVDSFFDLVMKRNRIKIVDNQVSFKNFEVVLNTKEEKFKKSVIKKLDSLGYKEILTIDEVVDSKKDNRRVIDFMIGKDIELLDDEYIISKKLYENAMDKVKKYIEENKEMSLADFRDMMNSSRKISMLILESFDKRKFTKRVENKRILY